MKSIYTEEKTFEQLIAQEPTLEAKLKKCRILYSERAQNITYEQMLTLFSSKLRGTIANLFAHNWRISKLTLISQYSQNDAKGNEFIADINNKS